METKGKSLPMYQENHFTGYDANDLISQTNKLRNLLTKRGTLEILIPLCCTTKPVRYKQFRQALKGISSKTLASRQFRQALKGISSKTLASRLKDLEKSGVLERHAFNEIPPRVEYTLTKKGQELITSTVNLLQWMKKWSKSK